MPDNENGQLPVEETTQPMPSENKPETEDSLPEDTSERTKEQFEKLKEKNKELAQKLEILEKVNQPEPKVFDLENLVPKTQPKPPVQEEEEPETPLTDENGYIDEARLKKDLNEAKLAKKKALEAEQKANEALKKIEEYEITTEKKRVHSAFPEIDPYSDKFVPELSEKISKDMLWDLVNKGKDDYYGTAKKFVEAFRNKNIESNKVSEEQQKQTEQSKNEIQEPNKSGSVSTSRKEELMRAIQQPKQAGMDALAELLSA